MAIVERDKVRGTTLWFGKEILGTAANSYPAAPDVLWENAFFFESRTIFIINTHATQNLIYKVMLKPSPGSTKRIGYKDANNTSYVDLILAPGVADILSIRHDIDAIEISFRNQTAGQSPTYSAIVNGRRRETWVK